MLCLAGGDTRSAVGQRRLKDRLEDGPLLLLLHTSPCNIAIPPSHLTLNLLHQLLQPLLLHLLLRPLNAQPLLLVRLGNHMHMNMIDFLMCQPAVVLQDIVVGGAGSFGNA